MVAKIPDPLPPGYVVEPPDVSHLVTEDDTPVDNLVSEKQMRLLTEPLYASWDGPPPEEEDGARRPFLAAANVGMFASIKDPPVVPDVFLSVDVVPPEDLWEKGHRSYFFWLYGKPPEVVIEVVSNREGEELGKKRRRYAKLRVAHYVVYDPARWLGDRTLTSFELRGELYCPHEPRFEGLGLGLVEWEGTYEQRADRWLRWVDLRTGLVIPTGAERASAAEGRAEAAEARAERLAQRLRALGVDPDSR